MDLSSLPKFKNEPFTDFSTIENKRAMEAALEAYTARDRRFGGIRPVELDRKIKTAL